MDKLASMIKRAGDLKKDQNYYTSDFDVIRGWEQNHPKRWVGKLPSFLKSTGLGLPKNAPKGGWDNVSLFNYMQKPSGIQYKKKINTARPIENLKQLQNEYTAWGLDRLKQNNKERLTGLMGGKLDVNSDAYKKEQEEFNKNYGEFKQDQSGYKNISKNEYSDIQNSISPNRQGFPTISRASWGLDSPEEKEWQEGKNKAIANNKVIEPYAEGKQNYSTGSGFTPTKVSLNPNQPLHNRQGPIPYREGVAENFKKMVNKAKQNLADRIGKGTYSGGPNSLLSEEVLKRNPDIISESTSNNSGLTSG